MSSFAWTSLVLVVYLIPGFALYFGYSSPSHKVRGPISMSTLEAIVVVVFVALVTHLLATQLITWMSSKISFWETVPDLEAAVAVLDSGFASGQSSNAFSDHVARYPIQIVGYFTLVSAFTFGLGKVLSPHYRRNADHSWALEIASEEEGAFTFAYVMTHIIESKKILMYRGVLEYLRLTPDGTIAYLLLNEVNRFYMHLEDGQPKTTDPEDYQPIGTSSQTDIASNKLLIEGEDIANVVFQEIVIPSADENFRSLIEAIAQSKNTKDVGTWEEVLKEYGWSDEKIKNTLENEAH